MELKPAFVKDAPPGLHIRPFEAHHQRYGDVQFAGRIHNAVRHDVATQDTPENVDKNAPYMGIGEHDGERGGNGFLTGSTSGIKKVGGFRSGLFDSVHCRHRQPSAVYQCADGSAKADVCKPLFGCGAFQRIALFPILKGRHIRVPFQCTVVKVHFGIQRDEPAPFGKCQRVDFKLRQIFFHGERGQTPYQCGGLPRLGRIQPPTANLSDLEGPQGMAAETRGRYTLRSAHRHGFDVHAAVRGGHDGQALRRTIEGHC